MAGERISAVIVATNEREALAAALPAWMRELDATDELIVVDNASSDGSAELVRGIAPVATVLRKENEGFGAAANHGAAHATGDVLLLLNSDVVPAPGFRDQMLRPLRDDLGWAAWMPLVTYDGGTRVNTSGGVAHFTGISWAGEFGRPVAEVDPAPREVAFVPGGAMAVLREDWEREGGFAPAFFMYCEDLDLSLRLRLRGRRVGTVPGALLDHDYEFGRSARKMHLLERNRWATILRTYPTPLLLAVLPALLLTELGLLAASLAGGWGGQKLRASADTLTSLPRLLRERHAIQSTRTISPAEFAAALTPDLSSPYLGRAGRLRPLVTALRAYWRVARALLR